MPAAIHARTWFLAIVCLTALGAGCRRVTIISFRGPASPAIDKLVVNLHGIGMKQSRELPGGLDNQLGLIDLPRSETTIDISAFGCVGDFIRLINDTPPLLDGYPIVNDAVLVTMVKFAASDQNIVCPSVDSDGGVVGEPADAGGEVDSGSGGSDGGEAGMGGAGLGGAGTGGAAGGGVGGMPGVGGTDGGIDAAGGASSDAGDGSTDATVCSLPNGPSQGPSPVMPTLACIDYCNQIIGSADGGPPLCPNAYESVDQCQQYCTRAAWAPGSSLDMDDTMACRLYSLVSARGSNGSSRVLYCTSAGASGGSGPMSCGMSSLPPGMCTTFCNAWVKICTGDASACLNVCNSAPAAYPACRFPWLVRAATDQRYCALVDFAAACLPPGC